MKQTLFTLFFFLSCIASSYGQWVPSTGADGNSVTAIVSKDNLLFSSTYGGGIFISSDNGMSWSESNNGLTSSNMTALLATDNALLAGNTYGDIFRSTDNGGSWTNMNPPIFSEIRILYAVGTTLYAGASGLYRSTNNGSTWTEVKALKGRYINDIIQKGTSLFVAGSGVLRSMDNGSTWTKIHNGMEDTSTFDFTVHGNKIYVTANWSVYSSTNNGSSWNDVPNPMGSGYPLSCLESSGSVLFAGTFDGVYYSTNSGSSWMEANTGLLDSNIRTLVALGSHLFIGTYYGDDIGIWRRSLGDFGIASVDKRSKASQEITVQCYPNPVRTVANLTVENAGHAVDVHTYDLFGKEYAMPQNAMTNAGAVSYRWDASIVPSGLYQCVVRTSNGYAHSTFLVQH